MLNTIDTTYEMTWDEYALAVEDALLVETGDIIADELMPDVLTAFETGMTPWGCVIALCEARDVARAGGGLHAIA